MSDEETTQEPPPEAVAFAQEVEGLAQLLLAFVPSLGDDPNKLARFSHDLMLQQVRSYGPALDKVLAVTNGAQTTDKPWLRLFFTSGEQRVTIAEAPKVFEQAVTEAGGDPTILVHYLIIMSLVVSPMLRGLVALTGNAIGLQEIPPPPKTRLVL